MKYKNLVVCIFYIFLNVFLDFPDFFVDFFSFYFFKQIFLPQILGCFLTAFLG